MDRRSFLGGVGTTGVAIAVPLSPRARASNTATTALEDDDWRLEWRTSPTDGFTRRYEGAQLLATSSRVAVLPRTSQFHDPDRIHDNQRGMIADRENGEVVNETLSYLVNGGAVVAEDRIVMCHADSDEERIALIEWAEWRVQESIIGFDGVAGGPPAVVGQLVLVPAVGELVAVDVEEPAVLWRVDAEGTVAGVTVHEGVAYVTTDTGTVSAIGIEEGTRRWRVDVEGAPTLFGPSVGGRRLVATDGDGGVYAVGLDGSQSWSAVPNRLAERRNPPDAAQGTVGSVAVTETQCFVGAVHDVFGDERTGVTAFALEDGTERWATEIGPVWEADWADDFGNTVPHGLLRQPRVGNGAVWIGGWRNVLALDPETGRPRRRWATPKPLLSTPLVAGDDVYFADASHLYAIDTGEPGCGLPSVEERTVRYENDHTGDTLLRSNPTLSSDDCAALVRMELVLDGMVLHSDGGFLGPEHDLGLDLERKLRELPRDAEEATVRLRGTAGTVIDERTVPIEDYRDDPPEFQVRCPTIDYDSAASGTRVSVTIDVINWGYDAGYVATLEKDGAVLTRETGHIDPTLAVSDDLSGDPCDDTNTTLTLSHVFTEEVPQKVRARVAPRGEEGTADSVLVDLSERRPPPPWGLELLLLGAGSLTALLGGAYWRRKRNEEKYY